MVQNGVTSIAVITVSDRNEEMVLPDSYSRQSSFQHGIRLTMGGIVYVATLALT